MPIIASNARSASSPPAGIASVSTPPWTRRRQRIPQKNGARASFFDDLAAKAWETGLVGWRSSADRPLLCPVSLLTGNFTGNFPKLGLPAPQRRQFATTVRGVSSKFPSYENRELFRNTRKIRESKQGMCVSALPKADIRASPSPRDVERPLVPFAVFVAEVLKHKHADCRG